MPRDYAKKSSSRSLEQTGPSGMVWLLMGVLLGMIIAGVFYLKDQHLTLPSTALPQVKQETPAQTPQTSTKNAPPSTQNLQTQFDFYNVLPSQKVVGPSGDEDTSTIQNQNNAAANPPDDDTTTATNPVVNNNNQTPNVATQTTSAPAQSPNTTQPTTTHPAPTTSAPVVAATPTHIVTPTTSDKTTTVSKTPVSTPPQSKSAQYILQIASFSKFIDADQLKAQLTLSGFEVNISPIQKNGQTLQRVWLGPFHSQNEAQTMQKQLQQNQINSYLLKTG